MGILRAGRLVEVAAITELRSLHRSEVTISYTGGAPDLGAVPGVEGVEPVGDGRLRFTLTGSPAPALRALAGAGVEVTALAVREPSLEEIFLDYYGSASSR
ncbi:DUF4162 domain-containing protein [Actinoplanes solisilvae]|uniref:ATP-binding protein DrrA1-3 family domain-containing protein n=1 Tax=Actinoplanes solisilvae TaxID=2486853 RepID=UPI001F0C6377|nr:DUF4162 domain-containing protein [Actinoplanes solisilvae]